MKISKKVLEQARSHVSNVTKPVTTGTYNLTLLHASWNEKNGFERSACVPLRSPYWPGRDQLNRLKSRNESYVGKV